MGPLYSTALFKILEQLDGPGWDDITAITYARCVGDFDDAIIAQAINVISAEAKRRPSTGALRKICVDIAVPETNFGNLSDVLNDITNARCNPATRRSSVFPYQQVYVAPYFERELTRMIVADLGGWNEVRDEQKYPTYVLPKRIEMCYKSRKEVFDAERKKLLALPPPVVQGQSLMNTKGYYLEQDTTQAVQG